MKKALLLVGFIATSAQVYSQGVQEQRKQALTNFYASHPIEKIYLHTDKPYYAVGDTLWFKAYIVEGALHHPDSASGVLYVDLVDDRDSKVVVHKIFRSSSGMASGAINLGDSLAEGSYHLRSYTSWLMNFSQSLFFSRQFRIYALQPDNEVRPKNGGGDNANVSVRFFPEGGNLVEGLQTRIAFQSLDQQGRPVPISGFVLSNQGDTVARVDTQHEGMGSFTITPSPGKGYTFHQAGTGRQQFRLPNPVAKGYTMMVDNFNKSFVKVYAQHNLASDRPILIVQQRGRLIYAAQAGSDKNATLFSIPRNNFDEDGVVQLTLFDAAGKPQCERIIFINKKSSLIISVTPDKEIYRQREKVSLKIHVTDQSGAPVQGNFSLAVTDAEQVSENEFSENIVSHLLLTSDIKSLFGDEVHGAVANPGYYFDPKNPKADQHLDLVMLTHGWRRFTWTEILESKSEPVFEHRIEQGITVSGQVLQPNGKPAKKPVDLVLMFSGGIVNKSADADGRFAVHDLDFPDSTNVLVQGTKANGGKFIDVKFDSAYIPPVELVALGALMEGTDSRQEKWLQQKQEQDERELTLRLQRVQMLKAVEVVAKKIERDPRRTMYSRNATTLVVDDKVCHGASDLFQLIRGMSASVSIRGVPPNMEIFLRNLKPALLIDGVPQFDMSMLNMMRPCEVEAIDITTVGSPLVSGGSGGVISILTRIRSPHYDWSKTDAKGISVIKARGFEEPREFYAPVYDSKDEAFPDFRATIFWEPMVRTDDTGTATISYYNSDGEGLVSVSVQGISTTGKPAAARLTYEVQQR